MKSFFTVILAILIIGPVFSQNQDTLNSISNEIQNSYSKNPDSVTAIADKAVESFKWDIQKEQKGTLMFLDVPYQRSDQDSIEYLSLTVAKDKIQKRPAFISIIVPNNVAYTEGIAIQFSKTIKDEDGKWQIVVQKASPVHFDFEEADNAKDYFSARIIDGYLTSGESKEKIDIFQKFLDFNHVYFLVVYPDKSQKWIGVPLFSFKQQYKTLL